MAHTLRLAASGVAFVLVAAVASAQTPPPAPVGFAWKQIESVKAAFLVPEGWHFKEEAGGDTRAFFISEESIDKGGEFQTGLSVNVIRLKKDRAQEWAAAIIAELSHKPGHELQDAWQTETGVLKGIGGRFRLTGEGRAPILEYVLAIGNSRTNTVYLIIFESPEAKWETAGPKGEAMLKFFVLDDEI